MLVSKKSLPQIATPSSQPWPMHSSLFRGQVPGFCLPMDSTYSSGLGKDKQGPFETQMQEGWDGCLALGLDLVAMNIRYMYIVLPLKSQQGSSRYRMLTGASGSPRWTVLFIFCLSSSPKDIRIFKDCFCCPNTYNPELKVLSY